MSTLRNIAICCGLGVLLLSGPMSALAAPTPTPKQQLDALWTSHNLKDLKEALYKAVKQSPKDVVALLEVAFSNSPKGMEQSLVEAAIAALRDLGTLDCAVWSPIKAHGTAKSDETDQVYKISDLAAFLDPGTCTNTPTNDIGVLPGEAANASPVGGVGNPMDLQPNTATPPSGTTNPPTGGGGGTAGPPFTDDDEPPATGEGSAT